jgi:hypothetical protein
MPGLVPGIHIFDSLDQDVDGRAWAKEVTPFFERLCPAMTQTELAQV